MSIFAAQESTTDKSQLSSNSPNTELLSQRKYAFGVSKSSLTSEYEGKTRLQAKLTIGASNDPLEQEADRVADQVLAAPIHSAVSGAAPSIQRFTGQSTGDAGPAPASVDRVLSGSGRLLDPAILQDMGQRFGHDFSRVRVHTGAAAEQSARDVNAHAYTVGHNIVFGEGQFILESYNGRHLIAHELTHVLQQSRSVGNPTQMQRDDPKPMTAAAKLQAVKEKLKARYGLKEISEQNGVAWTESELKKIDAAFLKMSPDEQKILKGVTLVLTDKIPSIKRKGRTIPIAGQTFGTFQVELTRAGVNKTTPIHEAGHLIHHTVIANAEKIFERSKFKDDLEAARLTFSVAVGKTPKIMSGSNDQVASFKQFNTAFTQVTTAAGIFEKSTDDDLKSNRAALEQAVQELEIYRYPADFGSEPFTKAWLALADQQSAFVSALMIWSDEKEKAVGPVKKLDEFVSIVKKHRLDRRSFAPFTSYAEANWPDFPREFFAEAYQSWRNNPAYMEKNGNALFIWFNKGGHLNPAAPQPRVPWKPIKIPMPKLPKTLHDNAPVIEELLIEAGKTFLPAIEGGVNLIP